MPVTRIKSRWVNGMQEFYEESTGEIVDVNAPVKLFDDFSGLAVDTTNDWNVDAIGAGAATVVAGLGGRMRLTTAAADDDDLDVASLLVFEAAKCCACEARIAQGDVLKTAFNFGFADATGYAADTIACMWSAGALTSTAPDCAVWLADSDSTTALYRCVAVANNVDGTVTAVPAATAVPVIGTFHTYRVELNGAGDCSFYFDGKFIYKESAGITTTDDLCVYVALINREAFVNTLDVDYIKAWQLR